MKFRQIISAICAIAVSVTFIPQTIISAENMTSYVTKTVNARDIAVKTTDGGVYTNGVSGTISGGELGYNSPQDGTDGKIYLYIPGIDASKLEAISICYGFNSSNPASEDIAPEWKFYGADSILESVSAENVTGKSAFASVKAAKGNQWDFVYGHIEKNGTVEFKTTADETGTSKTLCAGVNPSGSLTPPEESSQGIIAELNTSNSAKIYIDALLFKYSQDLNADNLIGSANLRKADFSNGTDVTNTFNLLTDGDYTNNQAISRGSGTYTYYAVYEINSAIKSISAYNTTENTPPDIIFYGTNEETPLLTTPPTEDPKWKQDFSTDCPFIKAYSLTYLTRIKNGTKTQINANGETVYKYTAEVNTDSYKYIVVLLNGWQQTQVSEIELERAETVEPTATPTATPTVEPTATPTATPSSTSAPEEGRLVLLDRTDWTAETNSQQATSGVNSVGMVLDGDASTIWHSSWTNGANYNPETNPVYLTINMGKKQSVTGIRYTPRIKDNGAGSINGVITAYEVYVSDDNNTWTKVGDGNMGYTKEDSENAVKDIVFSPVECQYVKLVVKGNLEKDNAYVGSCAEFDMYKYEGDTADHPITAAKANLDKLKTKLNALEDSEIKTKLIVKADSLTASGTVDGIETFLSTANMLTDALGWIEQGMDDVYIRRIMKKLTDSNMSAEALSLADAELKGFYTLGSAAKKKWETNCGEEYTISDEELNQPLYTRAINAINRAKAKIDSNDGKDYKMLKELVSYMSGKYQYTGYENAYGMNADNCEIIVSNINFTLSNLEKIEAGTLKTELTTYNSGEMWLDTLGSKISAHGGQIIKQGNKYYWYGEDNKISYPLTTGISCYSSEDLKNWTYEGIAFKAFDDGTTEKQFTKEFLTDNIEGTQGRIERPKVIYNEKNNNYVMWMHLEKDGGYGLSVMGVATSSSPTGPFEWKWYGRPVCDEYVVNGSYHPFFRDMNLFVDDDKKAYLFVSSENNQVMYEIRLNEDYTWIDADDLESSGSTYENIEEGKVITPDMTVPGGQGSYIGASYTYGKKSFTRYQLASGGAAALTKKKDGENDVKDENGNQIYVSTRPDGLLCITEYADGRWARVGQNTAAENKAAGKTETIVNNDTTLQREAPAPIKINGKYYLVTSGLSGWYANASLTQTADNILGPWTGTGNPMTGAGPQNNGQWDKNADTNSSFNSQSTCILQMPDGSYMYMGDRWKNGKYELPGHEGVKASTYIWLPVSFENDEKYGENTLKVRWHDSWSMGNIPTPAPEKPSKPSGEPQFDKTISMPEFIENADDTYDIMREYTVNGKYAPYYDDIWYYDRLPKIELTSGTKYDIKVKEYAENGTSTERGLYFILRNGETNERIGTNTYLQNKVMKTGDKAETVLSDFSGDEYKSLVIEMKIICFDENSKVRVGVTATPSKYKVTAGNGVDLVGISSGDYVAKDGTVKYAYNGITYTSKAITAPTEITAQNAESMGTPDGNAVKVTAGEGVTLINVPANGYILPGAKVRYTHGGNTYVTEPVNASTEIAAASGSAVTEKYNKYLFVHFVGKDNSGNLDNEKIYFSVSSDAKDWKMLNGGKPILESTLGTKGVRDPHIVRSPNGDGFHIIATDLLINQSKNWTDAQHNASKKIMIWDSADLTNWSEEREYEIGADIEADSVGCVWAPESIWDKEKNAYMVFWASMTKLDGETTAKQRIFRSYTSDFKTFTKPEIYIDRDNHVIDTTILEQDGVYYRYSKDETTKRVGCEYSTSLSGPWTATKLGIGSVEGPTAFKFNGENKWAVFVDSLGAGWEGYGMMETDNLYNNSYTYSATTTDAKPLRHGTVIPITDEEYNALLAAYPAPEPEKQPSRWDSYADSFNGKESDNSIVWHKYDNNKGGAEWNKDENGIVTIKSNENAVAGDVCYGLTAVIKNIKPSTKYYITFKEKTNFSETSNSQHGFYLKPDTASASVSATTAAQITAVVDTRNNNNISIHSSACTDADWEEKVFEWTSGSGIKDGNDSLAAKLEFTMRSALGSVKIKDLKIFDESEFGKLLVTSVKGNGIKEHSVIVDKIKRSITVPVVPGTDVSALSPVITANEGVSYALKSGTYADGVLTLTKGEETEEWTIKAVERANPVLDGFYADPNIVIFGDTYYIYPTTDGGTNWDSTNFKCFSSKDLIHWQDEGVILNLADVSWSGGKYGWAPTIAQGKDGKYYFYFSANGKTTDTKQLGVAVADSPTGPFVATTEPLISSDNGHTSGGQMIDPHVFTDDDGKSYIYWGNQQMYAARLNDDMISVNWDTFKKITPDNYTEGTFVIKRNNKYYFMWSKNDTGSWDYRVFYGTADSPLPDSIDGANLVLSRLNTDDKSIKATGHHSVINIPNTDEWYICYHRFNIPLFGDFEGQTAAAGNHREVCIDKMEFDNDGNIKVVTATLDGITKPVSIPTPPSKKTAVTSVVIGNTDYIDTLPQGGEITAVKIHRENNDNLDGCTVYTAIYKDGKLAGITLAEITEFSGNDEIITLTSPFNTSDAQELKVFVWNDNMKPMADMLYIER